MLPEPPGPGVLLCCNVIPPPPEPPLPPVLIGSDGCSLPPLPPPADVIVEKDEFEPAVLALPPAPTVIGNVVAVTVKAPQAAFTGEAV